jgi:hypothetical protein
MPAPQRDLELARKRLDEWFAGVLPDAGDIVVCEISGSGATRRQRLHADSREAARHRTARRLRAAHDFPIADCGGEQAWPS